MQAVADSQTTLDVLAPLRGDWAAMAAKVQAWRPGVVILVARKPPRVKQRLKLTFSDTAQVITDLAIPFTSRQLKGARVAVVDDVVNVGSTIQTVVRHLQEAGAAEVKVFAIGRVEGREQLDGVDVEYVLDTSLDEDGLARFADRVPDALQALAKPYDLDFPIIPCSLQFPLSTFADVFDALVEQHGEDRVWDLTTMIGSESGVRRLAVDVSGAGGYRKVRIYFDENAGVANVVPFGIGDVLACDAPTDWDAGNRLWEELAGGLDENDLDARSRLRLFIDALGVGAKFLAEHDDVLGPILDSLFAIEDAELVFGPRAARAAAIVDAEAVLDEAPTLSPADTSGPSPFYENGKRLGFLDAVVERAGNADPLSVFLAVFDELAAIVGAGSPDGYAWDWPYTPEQISEDPYKRLRVGPTGADLAEILLATCDSISTVGQARRIVSRLIDHYIDSGSVVPTIGLYENRPYRIYRKGEKGGRVDFADCIDFAVRSYHRDDISRTRVAKIATALSFGRGPDPMTEVRALPRGNVLCFKEELFDEAADVTQWMRDTGRMVSKSGTSESAAPPNDPDS